MRIRLLAVGDRMPGWVQQGYDEYARRFASDVSLSLQEIPAQARGRNSATDRIVEKEGEALLAAAGRDRIVTLDVPGQRYSTEQLSQRMQYWLNDGRDVALLVGGPEGLSSACRERADESWSLSPLTLPHPLVRVVVAEALYRAWTLLHGHPYHRA